MSSAGEVHSLLIFKSALNSSTLKSLNDLLVVVILSFTGFCSERVKHSNKWSEMMSSACTFLTRSESCLVMTKSRVWPPMCVGPLT